MDQDGDIYLFKFHDKKCIQNKILKNVWFTFCYQVEKKGILKFRSQDPNGRILDQF